MDSTDDDDRAAPGRSTLQSFFEPIAGLPVIWLVQRLGYGGTAPLWLLGALMGMGAVVQQAPVVRWLSGGVPARRRQLRMGISFGCVAATIYLVGWGPVLIPAFMVLVAAYLAVEGAAIWPAAAAWSMGLTLLCQIALARDFFHTYLEDGIKLHVIAFLMAVITGFVIRILGLSTADRERAEEDVRLRESRFRSLVQRSSDVIVVADADGVITYLSPSSERVTGIPSKEQLGTQGMNWVCPEDVPAVEAALLETLTRGPDDHLLIEARVQHGDGAYHWHEIVVRNLLDDPAVGGIVANHRDVSERRRWNDLLEFDATHDVLTGLPNRSLFLRKIEKAIPLVREGSALGVLFIDLDRFKQVNDSLGHDAGDQLLVQAAHRLGAVLRDGDVLARLGGDEFTVLLPNLADPAVVFHIVDQMQGALLAPFPVGGTEATVGASIGIVIVDDAGEDAESIVRNADMAMYRAKKGTSRFEIFDDSLLDESIMRTETERALRSAVDSEQLLAYFQPAIDLATGSITGAEALLRWSHPTRGILEPADFLPLAESTGLIVPMGERMLRESLAAAASWPTHLTVSVNMSSQQLSDPGFHDMVCGVLEESGVAPHRLSIEVLETHVVQSSAFDAVTALQALGVRVAIDDFGTGYSSLAYLSQFTVDSIKIDRRFIETMAQSSADLIIVTKIVELAHALDIQVVAEGVESEAQHHALLGTGCDQAQGFYWSVPVPAAQFSEMVVRPSVV